MPLLFLTGSAGALASAIRSCYLERGWVVAGFDRHDDKFEHASYHFFECNALDDTSMQTAFSDASQKLGAPRGLIATVGGVKPWKSLPEISAEEFKFLIDLNLNSAFYALRSALPLMLQAGTGSIVTIGAAPALTHDVKKAGYVAAKAAVIALTQVVANEGKEYGVNANCIVPTVIHTKANEEWGRPEEIQKWTPPESIAEMCFHLTSESGKAINGAVIQMPNKM